MSLQCGRHVETLYETPLLTEGGSAWEQVAMDDLVYLAYGALPYTTKVRSKRRVDVAMLTLLCHEVLHFTDNIFQIFR